MKYTFVKWLGNALICISLLGFVFTLYPLVQIYFFPKKIIPQTTSKGISISIPKISAQALVIENVDPWNEEIYKQALKKGVAHAKGSTLIGNPGTTFLFAHSSGLPWELTNNNAPFLRLDELEKGDKIYLTKNSKIYTYFVTDKKEVNPTEVEYLTKESKDNLILQTCTPIGTAFRRLLIFAKLQAA